MQSQNKSTSLVVVLMFRLRICATKAGGGETKEKLMNSYKRGGVYLEVEAGFTRTFIFRDGRHSFPLVRGGVHPTPHLHVDRATHRQRFAHVLISSQEDTPLVVGLVVVLTHMLVVVVLVDVPPCIGGEKGVRGGVTQ